MHHFKCLAAACSLCSDISLGRCKHVFRASSTLHSWESKHPRRAEVKSTAERF
jgi:hypothetical protein